MPTLIHSKERISFHCTNKDEDQMICFKNIEENEDYEWSGLFTIGEVGILSLMTRAKAKGPENILQAVNSRPKVRYFRIERKLHINSVFIVIEEDKVEQPTYKIENLSKNFTIGYYQKELAD